MSEIPCNSFRRRLLAALVIFAPAGVTRAFSPYEEAPIHYSQTTPRDAVQRLQAEIEAGRWRASGAEPKVLLRELLDRMKVPVESQVMVFSKTSKQLAKISPQNPRAVYFSDNAYVGWVPGGEMEVVDFDPNLGMVFYLFSVTDTTRPPRFIRDNSCLDCHANSATDNVPGVVVRSVYTASDGQPILSGGSFYTSHDSPLTERWGGWYVTGQHGRQRHMGNAFATEERPSGRVTLDYEPGANVRDLSRYFNTATYLRPGSDIVALMVLEHQVNLHNAFAAASQEIRRAAHFQAALASMGKGGAPTNALTGTALLVAKNHAEKLVRLLLFCGETDLEGEGVEGDEAFVEAFQRGAPRSRDGRSLKDFQLVSRLFKHRCSYLIYCDAFDAMPAEFRQILFRRLWEVLSGRDKSPDFAHLGETERQRIRTILHETKPGLPPYWMD